MILVIEIQFYLTNGENMKKVKRNHGVNSFVRDTLKIMSKYIDKRSTNNWRKMHGKPMKRKVR